MTSATREKTTWTVKAELVPATDGLFKSMAADLESKYGIKVPEQVDLLYVKSCLVTAGEIHGINDNDDVFTREEAWAARHTPLIKPANWQHNDKDIVGVVFSVEARDLDGNVLDFNSDEVPECEFEFWTEAGIFRLIQPEKAREIEQRSKAGNLFVSMEAWFDDYHYGLYNEEGVLDKITARNQETAFLDQHLKVKGGTGSFENRKLGRVLSKITFGGYGFVDNPANKRSVISDVGNANASPSKGIDEDRVLVLLSEVLDRLEPAESKEDSLMTANAAKTDAVDVAEVVTQKLDARDAEKAKAEEQKAIAARATAAEAKVEELEQQVSELQGALEAKTEEATALEAQMSNLDVVIEEISSADAGATGDTPPEIAAIDAASDGAAAFNAKLSWLRKSAANLKEAAAEAELLKAQLAEAAKTVRTQEVQALFTGAGVSDERVIASFVKKAISMSDEAYEDWTTQTEILLLASAGTASEAATAEEEGDEPSEQEALLAALKSEGEGLINPPGGADLKSGVTTNAPGLKTPRHKIAGSATDADLADALDNAQADNDVDLAGASQAASDDSEKDVVKEAFRTLAREVTQTAEPKKDASERPSFDPVD